MEADDGRETSSVQAHSRRGLPREQAEQLGALGRCQPLTQPQRPPTLAPGFCQWWEGPGQWGGTPVAGVSKQEYLGVKVQ